MEPREDVEAQRILLYEDEINRLKARLEQTERALLSAAVELEKVERGDFTIPHVQAVAQAARAALAASEGEEKRRVLINTRTGERWEWEPGLVLQAEGPLEWELREE